MGNQNASLYFLLKSILISLAVTLLFGSLYRLQFAGISIPGLVNLNLRQAHSHLGFYGVLIPLLWYFSSSGVQFEFSKSQLKFYFFAVVVSFVAFLWSGYNPVSHATSGVVLLFWLYYAIKNRRNIYCRLGDPMATTSYAFILALVALFIVLVVKSTGVGISAQQIVRGFLSILLFGAVLPVFLRKLGLLVNPMLYLFSLGLSFFYFAEIHCLGVVGVFLLAALLVNSFYTSFKADGLRRSRLEWNILFFTVSLFVYTVLPQNVTYQMGIAGLHYMVLVVLIGSFVDQILKSSLFNDIYFVVAIVMSAVLLFSGLTAQSGLLIQLSLALLGLILSGLCLGILMKVIRTKM